jgi:hypothetical protein
MVFRNLPLQSCMFDVALAAYSVQLRKSMQSCLIENCAGGNSHGWRRIAFREIGNSRLIKTLYTDTMMLLPNNIPERCTYRTAELKKIKAFCLTPRSHTFNRLRLTFHWLASLLTSLVDRT